MVYRAARTQLGTILHWLQVPDDSQWEEQIQALFEVIAILKELSRPLPYLERSPDPNGELYTFPALPAGINDAMPFLRAMLTAMRGRSRQDALDFGEAAWALLPQE